MRRFALVLVTVGCVLLGVTVVVASRPDRAPARVVRVPHAVRASRAAVLRVSPAPGARAVPLLPLMLPRTNPVGPRITRAMRAFAVPGGACDIAGGGCALHPCVTYAGSDAQTTVLRAPSVIAPAPGSAAAPRRPCVASAPEQRLVSARIVSAG